MRLEVFNIIDEALFILNDNNETYADAALELRSLFNGIFNNDDNVINIVTRIKEATSLKEKIIRKKLYSKYNSGCAVMEHLSDVVGIRIECRFIKDEPLVLNKLLKVFSQQRGGYFYSPIAPNIGLDLLSPQPQKQKNGIDIYRIDGYMHCNNIDFRFELQIKSLVKVFWAEIEHKIVYKNNSYRLIDDFFHNLMLSINNNLVSIDQQLMLIYEQMQKHDSGDNYIQADSTKQILAKAINDMLYNKMNEELGFTINFKKPCEILADFVFNNGVTGADAIKTGSMDVLVLLLMRIKNTRLDMQSSLLLERPLRLGDSFSREFGKTLKNIMNVDFEWNLFFRILFIMEPNNNTGDLEFFISYIRKELTSRCNTDNVLDVTILEDILANIAVSFTSSPKISFISRENLDASADMVAEYLGEIRTIVDTQSQWQEYKEHFLANKDKYILQ
ncbi:MAG: hypothetical protein IKK58_06570 [Clostridia bacterium]|nr:hypothetical protein [Clostridia bacterium]